MTKSRNTKRALLLSILSMMICVAMLAGSTFAWFTDTVTSGTNRIVAGNLNVELYYNNASTGGWKNASAASVANPNFFVDKDGNDILWEPGAMAVTQFKVANEGSLALKYSLATLKTDCNTLKGHDLSEVIKFAVIENGDYTTRDEILALEGLEFKDFTSFTAEGHLLPEDKATPPEKPSEEIFTVVAYWAPNPNDVDNLYNVNNGQLTDDDATQLYINIEVRLNASQDTVENDSFGNDYDYLAALELEGYNVVKTAEKLSEALAAGQKVVLQNDIAKTADTATPYGNKAGFILNGGVLDGNDKTLSVSKIENGDMDCYAIMTSGGTVKNLKIDDSFRGFVIMYPTEDIILNNVHIGGENVGYALNTAEGRDETVKLIAEDCSFAGWSSFAHIASASFTNCQFKQGSILSKIGYRDLYDRLVKPYVNTEFKNCSFSTKYYIDLSSLGAGCMITLDNCTVDNTVITAENYASLLDTIELPTGRTLEDCVIFK